MLAGDGARDSNLQREHEREAMLGISCEDADLTNLANGRTNCIGKGNDVHRLSDLSFSYIEFASPKNVSSN